MLIIMCQNSHDVKRKTSAARLNVFWNKIEIISDLILFFCIFAQFVHLPIPALCAKNGKYYEREKQKKNYNQQTA